MNFADDSSTTAEKIADDPISQPSRHRKAPVAGLVRFATKRSFAQGIYVTTLQPTYGNAETL